MATNRLVECSFCEHRIGSTCGICGCLISLKARLEDEQCPDPEGNRWEKFEEDEA